MNENRKVVYKGIECTLFESYFAGDSEPCVKIMHSNDIDKAYERGFDCPGYPDEIVKYLTADEYERLLSNGEL